MQTRKKHSPGTAPLSTPDPNLTAGLSRARRITVRLLSLLGLLTFSFMLVFVFGDALDRLGIDQTLEAPGSPEARIGADHPGEAIHLTGALAALVIGGAGLFGLAARPERTGSAYHTAATATAMLLTVAVIGEPDNHGGQGGPFDPAFALLAIPPLAAALTARPWRTRAITHRWRPSYLVLAVPALPALWYGLGQGLMQRNTWPPLADPHHQSHWYAMSLLAFLVVLVATTAAFSHRGWRLAAVTPALAAISVAVASLISPAAASALTPAWAAATLLWGLAMLAFTWHQAARGRPDSPTP
jgi:hypothetical protein